MGMSQRHQLGCLLAAGDACCGGRGKEESTPGMSTTKRKAVATEASENNNGLVHFPSNSRNELGIKNVVQK